MSQEWKRQFQGELAKANAEVNAKTYAEQEAKRKEVARKQAERRENENATRSFLQQIHAKEILEFVQAQAFQGKGIIRDVFTEINYYHTYSYQEKEKRYHTVWNGDDYTSEAYDEPVTVTIPGTDITIPKMVSGRYNKDAFMAGIALEDIPIIYKDIGIGKDKEGKASLFIGFGAANDNSKYELEKTFGKYYHPFSKFGVAHSVGEGGSEIARMREADELMESSDQLRIPQNNILVTLRDRALQHQAQNFAQGRVQTIVIDMLKKIKIR